MTFISRILGFVRDMLAAQIFGVNAEVDAFMIAFKLPNFMRSLFAEGAFSQAFVPTLAHYKETASHEKVVEFIKHISGGLIFILTIVTLLALVFMPIIVKINAPGFDAHRFDLAVYMCRITFPYLMLISLTALTGSILNNYGKFGIPALTPALLNVCLIIAALYFTKFFKIPIESQAWGIFIAGFVQLGFQLPFLKKMGLLVWPKINFQDPGVRRVLMLMLPAIFGASIVQIGTLINTIFASFLPTGSITWLYYSERLAYFPQGIFGVALVTVVLPHLSRQYAARSEEGFHKAIEWGIKCNLLIGLPAGLTMGILAGPLISTLFQYGHFSGVDVMMARKSVIAYSIGLLAFMLGKMLSAGFYARQNIKVPVKIGIFVVMINILLNIILIYPLKHAGLALATSLSSILNVILLIVFLYKYKYFNFQAFESKWGLFLLRLLIANITIIVFYVFTQGDIHQWLFWNAHQKALHLFSLLAPSMLIYLSVLWLCGMRIKHFRL
jgi:putative peptidoglycan lipid II flippase